MNLRALIVATTLLTTAVTVYAQEYKLNGLIITQPYARATVPQQKAGGAYLTIENKGQESDRLVAVATPAARSAEIHTMTMDGTVMRMREIDAIDIPPSTRISMKPGDGFHVMLLDLHQPLKAGAKFPLTLQFEKAGKIEVTVSVRGAKSGSQANGHHGH